LDQPGVDSHVPSNGLPATQTLVPTIAAAKSISEIAVFFLIDRLLAIQHWESQPAFW
jgi:hypothetical protein